MGTKKSQRGGSGSGDGKLLRGNLRNRKILVKQTWQDSCWRQARVVRCCTKENPQSFHPWVFLLWISLTTHTKHFTSGHQKSGFFPYMKQFSMTSARESYNSTQFWHYLSRDSIRFHRLRFRTTKQPPLPHFRCQSKSRLSPVLLTDEL